MASPADTSAPADGAEAAAIDPRALRDLLGTFATGVTIVTSITEAGERLGATFSSFNAVSLDPPLVLFSIARSLHAFEAWRMAPGYAINILAEGQTAMSNRFARGLTDKWDGVIAPAGPVCGFPLIPGAVSALECVPYAQYDGGDHLILVGRVVSLVREAGGHKPLVFHGSRYRILADDPPIATPRDADIWLHGW